MFRKKRIEKEQGEMRIAQISCSLFFNN